LERILGFLYINGLYDQKSLVELSEPKKKKKIQGETPVPLYNKYLIYARIIC